MSDSGKVAAVSHASSPKEASASPCSERAPAHDRDLAAALHEVSNALTVVLGWLEEARDASEGNERASKAVAVALSRALIGRDLARHAIGAASLAHDEEVGLSTLVHDAASGLEREAARNQVSLAVRVDAGVENERVRFGGAALQILTNLLLNAISMGSSAVVLDARLDGDNAQIAVIDDGPGIEPARRERIFEGACSSRPGGAGLGLRHAHALANERGGSLRLVPSAKGAHFELAWPVLRPRSTSQRGRPTGQTLAGRRLAVLDDDDAILDLLTTALEARGAIVRAVRTEVDLRAVVEQERIDAILLDLSPLSSDPLGLVQHLRDRNPSCRLVLVSGSSGGPPRGTEPHFAAWVRKPFEMAEVLATLSDLVDNLEKVS